MYLNLLRPQSSGLSLGEVYRRCSKARRGVGTAMWLVDAALMTCPGRIVDAVLWL